MSTLNEKIYRIIEDATAGLFQEDIPYVNARHIASNEIEKLILQTQIDLLKEVRKNIGENVPLPAAPSWTIVNDKISELTNQLNKLS